MDEPDPDSTLPTSVDERVLLVEDDPSIREVAAIDGRKLGQVQAKLAAARQELIQSGGDPRVALDRLTPAEREVQAASTEGDRQTLAVDALVPAVMALIYLALLVYFRSIGGYKVMHFEDLDTGVRKPSVIKPD